MAKEKLIPQIDLKNCMACRVCISACPFACLEATLTGIDRYNKAYPQLISKESCTGCALCSKECPVSVITMVAR